MDTFDVIAQIKNFLDESKILIKFPKKRKLQILALFYLASKFEVEKKYSEKEVDEIIKQWHTFNDWAMLRRYLYQGGFFDRHSDGSSYWLKVPQPSLEEFKSWVGGAM